MRNINREVLCVILGGGAGSRLYPLTARRSKPAVPLAGKYRLIDIPISNCLNSGYNRIFVLTQFNSASLNRHIKNCYHFDAFGQGFVDILAAEQTPSNKDWFQGTADAVRQVMTRLDEYDYQYVLILSGDQLYQMDLAAFMQQHLDNESELTIATIPVIAEEATGFGIMKVNQNLEVEKFIEKPAVDILPEWTSDMPEKYAKEKKHYLASMGIYLFKKETLKQLFALNPAEHDFGKGIIPFAINKFYKVHSYAYDGYWTDIGTIRSFFEANLELAMPLPRFNLYDSRNPVFTRSRMLSPSKLLGTTCTHVLIGDGCIINAKEVSQSIIGIRSRIGRGSVVRKTIMLGMDMYENLEDMLSHKIIPMGIGEDCHIENAIIDINCRIGNNVVIKGSTSLPDIETETYCVVDGIVVLKKSVVILPGTKIGDV
ncbi:MAG TPA: glucose-1-phosphate adenylyltransferase [Saprospiraceae bacterium]|nr:glucose-1-phosphate adenylyltransferase [Saprospiraceae bacterium]